MFSNRHPFTPLRSLTLACLASTAFMTGAVQADTVEIPVGSQGYVAEASHLRGKAQEQVSAELGEPISIDGPVGEPAITRWEYADFYVYFEYDKVLHTVKKHQG